LGNRFFNLLIIYNKKLIRREKGSMSTKIKHVIIRACKNKIVIITATLFILYTLTGFLLLPFLIERYLPPMLGQHLNSQVTLEQVKINPFSLTLEARDFRINEPSNNAIAGFKRLFINFQLSSIFKWALTFADVALDAPSINIVIDKDGRLNLSRLTGQEKETASRESEGLTRILMQNIEINQGKIDLTYHRQSIPANMSIYLIDIRLTNISTLPDRKGSYTLKGTSSDGAVLTASGQLSLQPLWSEGSIGFKQILLTTPWKFIRSQLNIAPPDGILSMETNYLLDIGKETQETRLDDLRVNVTDLGIQIEGEGDRFLYLPEIRAGAEKLDITGRNIHSGSLAIRAGKLDLATDKDGVFNIQRLTSHERETILMQEKSSEGKQASWNINIPEVSLDGLAITYTDGSRAPTVSYSVGDTRLALRADITTGLPITQVQVNDLGLTIHQISLGFIDTSQPAFQIDNLTVSDGAFNLGDRSIFISRLEMKDGMVDVIRDINYKLNLMQLFASKKPDQEISKKSPQKENSKPWQFAVDSASLSQFKTRLSDLTVKTGNPLIELDNICLTVDHFDGKSPSSFELDLNVVQGGELAASGKIDPSGNSVESSIIIKDLAMPIMQPYLSRMTDLTLNSGLFSAIGTFNRNTNGEMSYQGEAGIADLRIIENSTMDTLLGWGQLKTPGLLLKLNPNWLEIDTLKLSGLEGKFIISEDKKVNMVEAFRTKAGSSSTEAHQEEVAHEKGGETFPIRISKLSLDNGILDFADFSLRPQFATKIHELNGTIIGISSLPGARTQIELDGRVDEYGSSKIKGEINSFDPKQFTDISVVFRNVDMTNLTPYSGKFAGYEINSGKLSLDLEYKIEESQLLGENKIVIDTLVLGERVESPDAVKLPLKLAVALLMDANGVIDIDLPVSGDLDDPEFRYGPLIWKALVNLLTKIVTSPFRLLGSLFGGGEEEILDIVNFDPGESNVPPPEREKLARLLEALRQRPQLTIAVTGRYNSDSDGEVIREFKIRRALAEASGTVLEPGEDPGAVEFSNPKAQQGLAGLFIGRYGQEEYDKLTAEMRAPEKTDDTKQTAEDPGALGKLLYSDLVKREHVDRSLLVKLADERAQAITGYLTGPDGILPERIIIKSSESTGSGDQISSKLDLDVE
jgi:uncharacterized protein involved in outer membrane biogenesis